MEHLFFHPIIAYPQWAFHDCSATQSEKEGLDDWMVTVDEFNKIIQSVYDKGFILGRNGGRLERGHRRGRRGPDAAQYAYAPRGEKPLVISFDDVNYYEYMLEQALPPSWCWGTTVRFGRSAPIPIPSRPS